ncbi:histidinol-phosphate aminotransferase family protein [Streptomyces actinomycinicus]|uniref:histidinol-phosphate transaminase n=1 Tax=Streptomyces actinomycinicus TaxID=1695166 RepID=A0A937JQH4_9ACTN|nr:histidinol-phosphate transaminase [Streptomyces actinomycinicus]MBL1086710.1 histidinol-phosphate aminotransferase family protein [Streptomyces actinomycinicus]
MTPPPAAPGRSFNASIPGADDLIRLHLSESPYGASKTALQAAERELGRVNVYPDPERQELIHALAEHWDVTPEHIAVANGSDELVLATSLTFGDRGRPGLVTEGTFPGYRTCLEMTGRGCTSVPLSGTAIDTEGFAALLPEHGIGYLCNPHNPSGAAHTREELAALVEASGRSGVPLVFDEAYMEFAGPDVPQARELLEEGAPVVALRTFSKAYGLAALRIGYAVGQPALITALRQTLRSLPFSVNRLGQAAAVSALGDRDFLDGVRRSNAERRSWFTAELDRRGRGHLPSMTNFVAVAARDCALAQDRLAADFGILVRNAGLFGFPGYIRTSLGTQEDLVRFLDALDEIEKNP